ncbi:hypothetical protein HDU85_002518 [Gaertneriomyces sp. JEL0708]|nr:hypothetical protein HDU85_002518 [Gaertneriomyces sp. JEL0708]
MMDRSQPIADPATSQLPRELENPGLSEATLPRQYRQFNNTSAAGTAAANISPSAPVSAPLSFPSEPYLQLHHPFQPTIPSTHASLPSPLSIPSWQAHQYHHQGIQSPDSHFQGTSSSGASDEGGAVPSAPQQGETASRKKRKGQTKRLVQTLDPSKVWACDRCYRLKYKCDSARPACGRCVSAGINCNYGNREVRSSSGQPSGHDGERPSSTGPSRRQRAKKHAAGYLKMLETKVRQVEQTFAFPENPKSGAKMDLADAGRQGPDPVEAVFGDDVNGILGLDALPRSSSYTSQTNSVSQQPTIMSSASCAMTPNVLSIGEHPTAGVPFNPDLLLDKSVMKEVVMSFFEDYSQRWLHSAIHEQLFMSHFETQPVFLVYALCSVAASCCNHALIAAYLRSRNLPGYRAGEVYFSKAMQMIKEVQMHPSVEHTSALTYLKMASTIMHELRWSHILNNLCVEMAVSLNLHIDPDIEQVHGSLYGYEKERRRRVWWTMFVMDTLDTSPTNNVPLLPGEIYPVWEAGPKDSNFAVKAIVPESVWRAFKSPTDEPTMSAFIPGLHLDAAEITHQLTAVFMRIQKLHGTIWSVVDQMLNKSRHNDATASPPLVDSAESHVFDPSYVFTSDVQDSINKHDLELNRILDKLPTWARNVHHYETFTPSISSTYPPPWQLFTQHVVWHCIKIALHLPTLLIVGQRYESPVGGYNPADQLSGVYGRCRSHAQSVALLLSKLRKINPEARWISEWMSNIVFYSLVVLVMAYKTATDPTELGELRHAMDDHLWIAGVLGCRNYLGVYMYEIMRSLLENDVYVALGEDEDNYQMPW